MTNVLNAPVLTPEDHAFFLENGYVVVKNAVPPETLAAAVAFLDGGQFAGDVGSADYQPQRGPLVEACVTDKVLQAIDELFGEGYSFAPSRGAVDMPRPYEPEAEWKSQGIHVDDDYPTLMPGGWALGMFLFLTPVREHGGAFRYAAGSHARYRQAARDVPETLKQEACDPQLSGDVQEFLAEPGDLLLFHHLMGHAGTNNVADPQARHALLDRFHPHRRIVPGMKPFEQMTTIEKANSTRWHNALTSFDELYPHVTWGGDVDAALQNGFGTGHDIYAHVPLLQDGMPAFLFVDQSAPDTVRLATTQNLVHWDIADAATLPDHHIASLYHVPHSREPLLFVGTADEQYIRLEGTSWNDLKVAGSFMRGRGAAPHSSSGFGSKTARGQLLYVINADDPTQLRCQWSEDWPEAMNGHSSTIVATAPKETEFSDAFVRPTFSESEFALIADVWDGGDNGSRPFYARSRDCAHFETIMPLTVDAPLPVSQLRVLARARLYWLLTYLRQHNGQQRVFFATLDWEQSPPTLREVRTATQMQEAFCVVGLL